MITKIIILITFIPVFFVLLTHIILGITTTQKINFYIYLKCMFIEFIFILLHILFYPFSKIKMRSIQKNGKNKYPIILLHGYLSNSTDWWFQTKMLHQFGYNKIYRLNLKPVFGSIENHAKLLYQEIQRIKHETKEKQVIIIAHSRGGLVAAFCCEFYAKNDIHQIIALGTPFLGTILAPLAFDKSTRTLSPNSDFIQNLSLRIQKSKTPYYCIATKMDSIVIPWGSSLLSKNIESKANYYIFNHIGHLGLLLSTEVSNQLNKWLCHP